MRDYQPIKTSYTLPYNLYRQILYIIRDYPRMINIIDDMLELSPDPISVAKAKTNIPVDSVAIIATRRERYRDYINAIEKAKAIIPEEYMNGIWKNILYNKPYPLDAGRATYTRWKSRFIFMVGKYLSLI